MPKETLAVIDLGSNTFHLLIVEYIDSEFKTLYRERAYTFLSEGGIENISHHRLNEAIEVVKHFSNKLKEYKVDRTRIIGTAALRTANNSYELISKINDIIGIDVEVLDGNQEAQYIFDGIMCFDDFMNGNHLIMDIGGGSTEFIAINNGKRIWSNSYPLGVGLLNSKFVTSDPITSNEIEKITSYVKSILSDLKSALSVCSISSYTLIGSSGSFEVLLTMSGKEIDEHTIEHISIQQFNALYEMIIKSSYDQRQSISGLPEERTKLIIIAMLLKQVVINEICKELKEIIFCPYALKEGVLKEMTI